MNRIIKRCDEREILSTYNKETVAYYHNFRRKGTFMNDYLIAPRLRTLLKSKFLGRMFWTWDVVLGRMLSGA